MVLFSKLECGGTIISVIPNLSDNKCFFICFKVILSTAKSSINASISAFSPNNNKTSLCSKYVEAFGVMVVLDSNLGIRPFSVLSIETTVILYLFVSCNSFNCFPFKGECAVTSNVCNKGRSEERRVGKE